MKALLEPFSKDGWRGRSLLAFVLLIVIGIAGYFLELSFPTRPPKLENTFTPLSQPTTQELGAYDILGKTVSKAEADELLQTERGKIELASENGAIAITQDLIEQGRDSFYRETFGNEYFFTDVVGILDGQINLISIGKAIAALGGKPTTNLQIPIEKDVTIGGHTFKAGTLLDTGLDIAKGSLVPLGIEMRKQGAKLRAGITCAACHATVDPSTGKILEGAPNVDLDTGLLQAFASNSAAMFRQTGVNPKTLPTGDRTYINAVGQETNLVDRQAMEDAVDAQLLAWSPGNFDSSPDNQNNPSQNPSSYTFQTFPYGWSGFASIGWFHGLTTLNNNVHAVNSDPTTGTYTIPYLSGIDRETYLGTMLQGASDRRFRLPDGAKPTEFLEKVDPTPGTPGMNEVVKLPGHPKGSIFMLDGLMANSPGKPLAYELNGMSAYQNTLSPPPYQSADAETLERGATIFEKANCATCHSGRYFTNHHVISQTEIQGQPSRASALAKLPPTLIAPETYPPNLRVPLPIDPNVLPVPVDITPQEDRELAFAINDPAGGYKVQNLIGLAVTAPYLHDGGVAASKDALEQDSDGFYKVADPTQMGLAGTWMQRLAPDPEASLRVLVDRKLREVAVAQNRANHDLQLTNGDGSGHHYWVDQQAGFTSNDQSALVQFLLSIDDDPAVLPSNVQ